MFNGGLMVLKPKEEIFQMLWNALLQTQKFNYAEMGFLNTIFENEKKLFNDVYMIFQVGESSLK
jgi:hypothetical protein